MTYSTSVLPRRAHTVQPAARRRRAGACGSSPPNNASGRLLPVDVKPGTRHSCGVMDHLVGHGLDELRFALVQRSAVQRLAHGAHNRVALAMLEEIDRHERLLEIGEHTLQLLLARVFANLEQALVAIDFFKHRDRKSTRLNSSHQIISYAVFCL